MDIVGLFLDIVKLIVAGITVFFIGFYAVKSYLAENSQGPSDELKKAAQTQTLPLRLQAYERIVLYVERMNPASMLLRLHVAGMSATELQTLILIDIRTEYQHNISQQLYVSGLSWAVVKKVKDDTVSLINNALSGLPENASSMDLSRTVLTHLSSVEDNPYDAALSLIKNDIYQLF